MAGRLLTPAFAALALSELAYFIAIGIMIPVVPLYAAGPLAEGPVGVGVGPMVFGLVARVSSLPVAFVVAAAIALLASGLVARRALAARAVTPSPT